MERERLLGTLRFLLAVGEQANARLSHTKGNASVGTAHLRKLYDHLRSYVGIGTEVKKDGPVSVQSRHGHGESWALDSAHPAHAHAGSSEDRTS